MTLERVTHDDQRHQVGADGCLDCDEGNQRLAEAETVLGGGVHDVASK